MSSPFWGAALAAAEYREDPVVTQLRQLGYRQDGIVWSRRDAKLGQQRDACECGGLKKTAAKTCVRCYEADRALDRCNCGKSKQPSAQTCADCFHKKLVRNA